jgi:hypothetical protein
MSEEVGRIEMPSVGDFKTGRRVYFVPLIFTPHKAQADLLEKFSRYWEQVDAHVTNLELKLGSVNKVYHELVPIGGEDGAKVIEELNKGSYQIAKARLERGAELQPVEDAELLTEFMDWSKCLATGLQSQNAIAMVYQLYSEAQKRRNEYMAKQIDATLKSSETGLVLMLEGHQVQFPSDIEVFYVAPPGLDEVKRWLRERETQTPKRSRKRSRGKPK